MTVTVDITNDGGSWSGWDSVELDGGHMTVTAGSGLGGSPYGMNCYMADTNEMYGRAVFARQATTRYRFYLDPNSLSMGDSTYFTIMDWRQEEGSWLSISAILLSYYTATGYRLTIYIRQDGSETADTFDITDAPHYIEVKVVRATTDTSADGTHQWWVDGADQGTVTGLDNYNIIYDQANHAFWLGPEGIGTAPSGNLFLDELKANDDGGLIGPRTVTTNMTLTGGITPTGALSATRAHTIGPIAVNASADDADEIATGVCSITANPLANVEGANIWNGFIFRGVTIPAGATIDSSYLIVNMTSTSLDEPDVTFFGLDTATPAAFTTGTNDLSGRTRTTASVAWSNTNAGSDDVNTSDLSTILQELVNSYTYSSGVMGFVFRSTNNTATRDTSVTSYDGSTTLCARLVARYTVTVPIATSTPMTLTGATTPSGVLSKVVTVYRTLAGGSTPGGTVLKQLARSLSGAITSLTGTLITVKQKQMSLAGELTMSGVLTKARTAVRTWTGEVTFAGTLTSIKSWLRTLTGAVGSSGTLVRQLGRSLSGATQPSGVLTKGLETIRLFVGDLTSSGVLTKSRTAVRLLVGDLTFTGTLGRVLERIGLTGSLSLSGTLVTYKSKLMTLVGELTSSGALTYEKIAGAILRTFTGGVTFVGTLSKELARSLAGEMTPTGIQTRVLSLGKTLSGALSSSGTLTYYKAFVKLLEGAAGMAGTLTRQLSRSLGGDLTPSGILTRVVTVYRTLAGAVSFTGTLSAVKGRAVTFLGEVTSSGTLARVLTLNRTLAGAVTSGGTLARSLGRSLAGTLTQAGTLAKGLGKGLAGAVGAGGVLTRTLGIARTLSGELVPSGLLTRTVTLYRTLVGVLNFVPVFVGTLAPNVTRFVQLTLPARTRLLSLWGRTRSLTLEVRTRLLRLRVR